MENNYVFFELFFLRLLYRNSCITKKIRSSINEDGLIKKT